MENKNQQMIDAIIGGEQFGKHIINIQWGSTEDQQEMEQLGIEILRKFMLKDEDHDKDFLFFPLLNLIKDYLRHPLNFEVPTELEEEIGQMRAVIQKIEELYAAKERINIDFCKFNQLIQSIIERIDGMQTLTEEAVYN